MNPGRKQNPRAPKTASTSSSARAFTRAHIWRLAGYVHPPFRPEQEALYGGACQGRPLPGFTRGPALAPRELARLLVPGLAVDHGGLRLGSGGGWYDRLRADPLWRAVPALVVVPAVCVVARLPGDPWDVPFPGWLTETGLHWITAAAAAAPDAAAAAAPDAAVAPDTAPTSDDGSAASVATS